MTFNRHMDKLGNTHVKAKSISHSGMSLVQHALSPYKCNSIDGKKIDKDYKQLKKIFEILKDEYYRKV